MSPVRFQTSLKFSASHPLFCVSNFFQENLRPRLVCSQPERRCSLQLGAILSSSGVFALRPKGKVGVSGAVGAAWACWRPRRQEPGSPQRARRPPLGEGAQQPLACQPRRPSPRSRPFSASISSGPHLSYLTSSRSRRREKGENKRKPLHCSDSSFTGTEALLADRAFFSKVTFSPARPSTKPEGRYSHW